MSTLTHTHPALSATASRNPTTDVRFTVPYLVRVTPQLDELVRQAAAGEGQGLAEFVRDSLIIRLGFLGLVPVVTEGDDEPS